MEKWLFTIGAANFFIFGSISISIGGNPDFEWKTEPPYILFNHGETEVSFPVYLYACIHQPVTLILIAVVVVICLKNVSQKRNPMELNKTQGLILLGSLLCSICTVAVISVKSIFFDG